MLDPELESRDSSAQYLLSVLERLKAKESLETPEKREQFLKELTPEKFKRWLLFINDALRDQPKSADFDGKNVRVQEVFGMLGQISDSRVVHIPPHQEDKEALLTETLKTAQNLPDTKDAALLLAANITAIHPFEDGNGRISRLTYELLTNGYDGSEERRLALAQLLGPDGRKILNTDPRPMYRVLNYIFERAVGINHDDPHSVTESYLSEGLPGDDVDVKSLIPKAVDEKSRGQILEIINERAFTTVIFYRFLKEQGLLHEPYIEYRESPGRMKNFRRPDNWTFINLNEVLKSLTPETASALLQDDRDLRKTVVQAICKAFEQPDGFPKIGDHTIVEYFKTKALQKAQP